SAQQMSGLSHPTIVSVLNKPREENAIHYVVIELQSGGNLRQWVQGGKLTRMQLMRTLQRLGSALGFAHDKKVFHRDIKPTNVFVRRDLAARFSGLRRRGAGKCGLACAASQTF
ncbi:MAG TPA: protein kinase, partial [Pseudomonadota bacterium]|nr:protein kinase [Pseudomonadota bacterium]